MIQLLARCTQQPDFQDDKHYPSTQQNLPQSTAAPTQLLLPNRSLSAGCRAVRRGLEPDAIQRAGTEKATSARRHWSVRCVQPEEEQPTKPCTCGIMRRRHASSSCKNIILLQKLEITCIFLLEWIEDIINAIAYYSILRNATAHMHRICF